VVKVTFADGSSRIVAVPVTVYDQQPWTPIEPPIETDKGEGLVNDPGQIYFDLEADDDKDGYTNREELLAGTDYLDPNSKPTETVIEQPNTTTKPINPQPTENPIVVEQPDLNSNEGEDQNILIPDQSNESNQNTAEPVGRVTSSVLPNTGEADISLILGTAALAVLAGVGLFYKEQEYEVSDKNK
ncbi:TPA: LPXTG cell wall anchor domain-containing protein, partial [Streptococcus suis]